MIRTTLGRLFRIQSEEAPRAGASALKGSAAPRRPRHFSSGTSSTSSQKGKSSSTFAQNIYSSSTASTRSSSIPFGAGADAERLHGEEYNRIHNTSSSSSSSHVPRDFHTAHKKSDLYTTIQENRINSKRGTADLLSSASSGIADGRAQQSSSFVSDGIDEAGYQTPKSKLSKAERRARMREALEEKAHSYVAFSEEGLERDFISGGVPQEMLRSEVEGVTISGESSMFSTLFQQKEFKSKRGVTSWSLLARDRLGHGAGSAGRDPRREGDVDGEGRAEDLVTNRRALEDEWRSRNTLHDRQWREDESSYHMDHDDPILEHAYESVQNTVSIYTRKRMYMDGLFGVERFITREEERALCEELVRATQSPTAVYVPEEGRYCVNLYERELGIPDKDPLALSLNKTAPLLMDIFLRAFYVGLIPAIPNMAQVSEFIGAHSGYPATIKSNAVGSYLGSLSLVSPTVMHMSHCSAPWRPKLYLQPRSLYIVQQPSLSEFRIGFRSPSKTTQSFRHLTRQTKDYRIEVLFACMDTKQSPLLKDAVNITNYAQGKLLTDGSDALSSSSSRSVLGMPDLNSLLAQAADGGEIRQGVASKAPMDGLELKKKAQTAGLVGERFKSMFTSSFSGSSSSPSSTVGDGEAASTGSRPRQSQSQLSEGEDASAGSVSYNPTPRRRVFSASDSHTPPAAASSSLSDMAKRIARVKAKERAAEAEEKERNKFVSTGMSPIVPGRYKEDANNPWRRKQF